MLAAINEFVNNNSTLVLLGLVAIVVLIGFVMFRRSSGNANTPIPTPSHDLEGLDNTNMVCDLANGVCMSQQQPEYHQEMPMEMEQQGNIEQEH